MKRKKQLKSTSKELLNLFEDSILVRHIAEELEFCEDDENMDIAQKKMDERDFDVLGIAKNAIVYGYVNRHSLGKGHCEQYTHTFHPSELIAESTPLLGLLLILHDKPRVFVLEGNCVNSIVTRGDLQKAPVRMLLFGMVSLLEMQLLRIIEDHYPSDSWQKQGILKSKRIEEANKLFYERQQRNETIDLADCLQFCDKREIVLKTPEILKALGFGGKEKTERFLKETEKLRDKLAHSQDVVTGSSWPEILDLVKDMKTILGKLEEN
ncbi:MAG: hypothetical protein HY529_03685 [Chloroflexi bacterium]|nr:hypothetical protein [Chloroflexota bacterium]